MSSHRELIPNFISYLDQFGESGISRYFDVKKDSIRLGIFLRKNSSPQLIGILKRNIDPISISYERYVPKSLSERDFFG